MHWTSCSWKSSRSSGAFQLFVSAMISWLTCLFLEIFLRAVMFSPLSLGSHWSRVICVFFPLPMRDMIPFLRSSRPNSMPFHTGEGSAENMVLCLCQILCTCWVTFGLRVVLGVDRIRVVSESNSCTLGLPYNEGSTTRVTYDDLIATGTQGEPAACAGA